MKFVTVKNKPIPSRELEHHTTDIVIVDYFKEVRGTILSLARVLSVELSGSEEIHRLHASVLYGCDIILKDV